MQLIPFRATFPKMEFITSPTSFCESIKENYSDYAQSGFFTTKEQPAFYIYQIQKRDKLYSGLLACIDIGETAKEEIKPHEKTLAAKEQKQIQLLLKRKATVKPIVLTYKAVEKINFALHSMSTHRPLLKVNFEKEAESHHIWAVEKASDQAKIKALFEEYVFSTYIADGHHRCATAHHLLKYNADSPYRKVLCALFPSNELEIHDFNRVVDAFDFYSPTRFMALLSNFCEIKALKQAYKPRRKHEILLIIGEEYYLLNWKKDVLQELGYEEDVLDTQLLNDLILMQILGMKELTNNDRIQFVEGPRGLEGLIKKMKDKPNRIAFALYPIQMDELFNLADQSFILPAKSTWFEPRLKNGLINYKYDNDRG